MIAGAGLAGLGCALRLSAAGWQVLILEPASSPGGLADTLELAGFRFDTGVPQAAGPDGVAAALDPLGERVADWLEFAPGEPVCRAHFPNGSTRECYGPRAGRLFGAARLFGSLLAAPAAWYPVGGARAVPEALAAAAQKHGVAIRYGVGLRGVQAAGGRLVAVRTTEEEWIEADLVVLPDRPAARADRRTPAQLVLHLGAAADYRGAAMHNLHFGQPWRQARTALCRRGELMTDPTLLVVMPSRADPTAAPAGAHVYQVVVPVPNLWTAPVQWTGSLARGYAAEIVAVLEARGYLDLGSALRLSYLVTPDDWALRGMPGGIPQSGTNRPGRLHPTLNNVILAGPGLESGISAAERVIGARNVT